MRPDPDEAAREDTYGIAHRMGMFWPTDTPWGLDFRQMDPVHDDLDEHITVARALDLEGTWTTLLSSFHIYWRDVNFHVYGWIGDNDDIIVNTPTSVLETLEALGVQILETIDDEDEEGFGARVYPTPRVLEEDNMTYLARLFDLDPATESEMRRQVQHLINNAWREMTIDHSTAADDQELYSKLIERAVKNQLTKEEKQEFLKLRQRMAQRAQAQRNLSIKPQEDDDLPGFYI